VRRSTNSGASFASINAKVVTGRRHGKTLSTKLASLDLSGGVEVVPGGSTIVASGQTGVFESTNGGSSWKMVPQPAPHGFVELVSFLSATTGYEAFNHRVYFTHDGGRHWKLIQSIGSAGYWQLSFSSVSDGYLVTGSAVPGTLLRTEDAGRTWVPEVLPNPQVNNVTAAGSFDYATGAGTGGEIFQTTDGGMSANRSTLTLAIRGARKLSRAKLKRVGNRVNLSGRLSPAAGGENVVIAFSTDGASWHHVNATVSSGGTFAATVSGIRSTTNFVAQWGGNDLDSGAGTPATTFTVTPK